MNKPSDFDVGPLTWVKGEIDQALDRSLTALKTYAASPGEPTQLKFCRTHFHQAHGALQIVGLDGVTRLSEEVESLLAGLGEDGAAPSDEAVAAAEQAYQSIRAYLEELLTGELNQPLKLYEVYQAVSAVRGREADPIDLYYPDLSRRPPRREQPAVAVSAQEAPNFYRRQRTRYQRGLLQWIQKDEAGIEAMRVAVAAVEAVQTSPAQRAFWWVALGFFDALAAHGLPAQPTVHRLCNRIEQQLKRLVEGSTTVAERLMREALFAVARAQPVSEHVRQVQEIYALASTLPDTLGVRSQLVVQHPALRALRDALTAAKTAWNKCASGHRPSLTTFGDQAAFILARAEELDHPALSALGAALGSTAQWLIGQPDRIDDIVAMEVATALLLVENGVENHAKLGSEFSDQAALMCDRLQACVEGNVLGAAAPVPVLDEMSRRAQERLLMSQVVAEIQASLRTIEQALDEFFRDSTKRAALSDLSRPVRQVLGAFTMLSEDEAAAVLSGCFVDIQRFAQPGYEPSHADFERVAGALSGLGFYVEALQHGKADLDAFMNPIGAATNDTAQHEEPSEDSVEDEINAAKGALERQFDAWRQRPEDRQLKAALQAQLTAIHKDANLVADAALERRVGEMLALLAEADAQPFDAEISQVMQNIAPATAVAQPSPEAAKLLSASDEIVDAELLAVYLEEAGEVLNTIAEHLDLAREQPQNMDVLRTIRRGYHTLKGSGRMVGLTRLSEGAWAIEQVMNRWLEDEHSATPDLLTLIEAGREFFAGAVEILKEGGASPDESGLVAMAQHVKQGRPLAEFTALAQSAAVPPVSFEPFGLPREELETGNETEKFSLDFTQPIEPLPPGFLLPPVESAHQASTADYSENILIGDVELSPSLFTIFITEAQELLAALRKAHASPLPGAFDEDFRRSLHTLTGIAGTAKFDAIRNVSEALEELLARLSQAAPDPEARAAIGAGLDALEAMVRAAADMRLPEAVPDLLARLNMIATEAPGAVAESFDATASLDTIALSLDESAPIELDFSAMVPTPPAAETASAAQNVVNFPRYAADAEPAAPLDAVEDDALEDAHAGIRDDLDPQLLPIFLEEAQELVPSIGSGLREWRDNPGNVAAGHSLQRVLHTLKGSARMAGAMAIGELTHAMETRVENAVALRTLPLTLFDELENAYDRVSALYEQLLNPDAAPAPEDSSPLGETLEDSTSAAPAMDLSATAFAAPVIAPEEAEVVAQQRALLRVRADVIDRLVNEAGEVSISRSRIEGEMRNLKGAVHDLTENVSRLRAQLREIEIQAESQMQSKMSLAQEQHAQFDPLEFDRFTRFQELTRMMAESVNDVSTVHNNLLKSLDESDAALSAQGRLTRELQGNLMRIRMVPFASVSERLYRVVRQAAKDSGKRAVLDVRGSQVELDRSVLERITAPFEHMLRNCVAHGIEAQAVRVERGKAQTGEIRIEVRQEGNEVMLTISDDGGGLDFDRIRAKAESLGLIPPDVEIGHDEIAKFIFHPGFSTADEVTQLSGRGIGMDVVQSEIAALGGRVDTQSVPGKGTSFTVFLPLTTAVTQAVLVRAAGYTYAIPSVMVEQIRQFKVDELQRCHEAGEVRWQDRGFPLRYLPRLLGNAVQQPEKQRITPVMLARSGPSLAAVQVDEVIGNQEIVVKNTGPLLARVIGITGATVLGTGEIVLILNPVVLSQQERQVETQTHIPAPVAEVDAPSALTVMIVDDSLTVRKITGRLLSREGYQVLTAKDGVDAMEQLQEARPDVMLVDIEMPRMDGFDLTRNIRNDAKLKHIPIIMITSRTAEKHRNYAAQIGVNVYLGKPFQEDQLLEHISAFVKRPALV